MHTYVSFDPAMGARPNRCLRLRVTGVVLAALLLFGLAQPHAFAGSSQVLSSGIVTAASASEPAPGGHHTTVAGIPTPLAGAVGAIILVLMILLAITALTRHRHDDDERAVLDLEE